MRWVPHKLEGKWAVRNVNTDELLRGWRKDHRKLIWRGSLEEASSLCGTLEKAPPREETSQSQIIMHVIAAKKRGSSASKRNVRSRLSKCRGCGKVVKSSHQCKELDNAEEHGAEGQQRAEGHPQG